jgi:hypothetical protein
MPQLADEVPKCSFSLVIYRMAFSNAASQIVLALLPCRHLSELLHAV